MTVKEMADLIDREGRVVISNLGVNVRVVDARAVYGREQVRITPLAGDGMAWVELTRVKLNAVSP